MFMKWSLFLTTKSRFNRKMLNLGTNEEICLKQMLDDLPANNETFFAPNRLIL